MEDYNKDGKINSDDRQIFKSNIPTYFFGIANKFTYKDFDLSVLINGAGGNQILNMMSLELEAAAQLHKNHYKHWINRWRSPENPGDGITPSSKASPPVGMTNQDASRYLYDGDFMRLKNVTIGYTLPKRLADDLKIARIRFYVECENIYTLDKYRRDGYIVGFTPESDLQNGNPLAAGYDYGTYPPNRSFLFGVNVTF